MYKDVSCKEDLSKINIPVLFLNSKDDPIVEYEYILISTNIVPRAKIVENKKMIMIET